MSITEINNLTIEDTKYILQGRLYQSLDPQPVLPNPLPEDFDMEAWNDSHYTDEELEESYK